MSAAPKAGDGQVWFYKGTHYTVIGVFAKQLIQFEDEWHPTVKYRLTKEDQGLTFVRSVKEFERKFDLVRG